MEDILVINGVKYIKQSTVEQMEKDLNNIKQAVALSVANLGDLVGNQVIAQSTTQKPTVNTQPTTQEIEQKNNYPKNRKSAKPAINERKFQLRKIAKQIYTVNKIDEYGNLYSKQNRQFSFTIQDVLEIRKELSATTTNGDIERMMRRLDLPKDTVHRIIYNIQNHVFDDIIKEHLSSVNDIKVTKVNKAVENNPQKRKEAGIYS